jgi:hypothetical protein
MQDLKIGLRGREERGVLFLYDTAGQRLRIEIGYGLEEYFPDAFIGYLIESAQPFSATSSYTLGTPKDALPFTKPQSGAD